MESNIHLADFQSLIFGIWQGTLIWEGQSWINWYWFDFAKHHHHWQVSKVRPRAARAPKRPPPLFKACWAFSYKLYWQWTLFLDNLAKMPPNALGTWNITILHFCLSLWVFSFVYVYVKFMMASLSQIDISMLVCAEFPPWCLLFWDGEVLMGGFSFIFSAFFWCKCLCVLSRWYQDCTRNTLRLSIYRCKWP